MAVAAIAVIEGGEIVVIGEIAAIGVRAAAIAAAIVAVRGPSAVNGPIETIGLWTAVTAQIEAVRARFARHVHFAGLLCSHRSALRE